MHDLRDWRWAVSWLFAAAVGVAFWIGLITLLLWGLHALGW